jgi:hypothetical protein
MNAAKNLPEQAGDTGRRPIHRPVVERDPWDLASHEPVVSGSLEKAHDLRNRQAAPKPLQPFALAGQRRRPLHEDGA